MAAKSSISLLTAVLMTFVGGTLDAYTYLGHGVFATAQTGNVVLLMIGLVTGVEPWQFVWPILAFLVAILAVQAAKNLEDARRSRIAAAAVLGLEVVVLVAVGFVPATASALWITVPLSAFAGAQLGLFRVVSGTSFVSVATTGNLMRLAEALYAWFRVRHREELRVLGICALVVATFATGALLGAVAETHLHAAAIWASAVVQLGVLVSYLVETRPSRQPAS